MKLLKYKKDKGNSYKVLTDKGEYKLYDDIIINFELLLKKEISEAEWEKVKEENNLLKAYYDALKSVSIKMRTEEEIRSILKKKKYNEKEIKVTIKRLIEEKYINHKIYIEAYIHDHLSLYLEGEKKIASDLINKGMTKSEIEPYLSKIDNIIYQEKIKKYIEKKLKTNKKSKLEFTRKVMSELLNKGFEQGDIALQLENIEISENNEEIERIIERLYKNYIKKYDYNTTKLKIKSNLYKKGYFNYDIENFLDKKLQAE